MPIPTLTPWEQATGVAAAAQPGVLPVARSGRLTLALLVIFSLMLWGEWGLTGVLPSVLFARLMALDLTTYTLPNIYTVPLMVVGLLVALDDGRLGGTLWVWLALALVAGVGRMRPGSRLGIGEGDLKLLAAMVGFVGLFPTLCAVALGCLLWLPAAWATPGKALPLGVPLLLGWVVILAFPALPNALFSTISI